MPLRSQCAEPLVESVRIAPRELRTCADSESLEIAERCFAHVREGTEWVRGRHKQESYRARRLSPRKLPAERSDSLRFNLPHPSSGYYIGYTTDYHEPLRTTTNQHELPRNHHDQDPDQARK